MNNKPASRRGHRKRATRREKRLAALTVVQTLLVITKVILWLFINGNHHS